MRPPEGMRITAAASDDPRAARFEVAFASVVHRCPPIGQSITPCCERTPFELPMTDRITLDPALVTCGVTGATTDAAQRDLGPAETTDDDRTAT